MAKRVHVTVRGHVQNVGFRAYVQSRAQNLGVVGWVRNMADRGQVELEAEGDDQAVDALVHAARAGPTGARVQSIAVEERPMDGSSQAGFSIR